ncbi:type II toxin-antitoxin system HipA family toxin [Subsaximicrobium wynnwilliamsii]|uniref:Type II toxin-antitoxin system HipA family toxin n=1 Tax=Subsaximicrobium wynnwilliamsii TaxID=291179 RepID=A0A5C6ZJN9_9FLAO|nr:HipA domain-containing protein [Subsaximicrobium wynnwilliamsii]TXD84494.1 type II toxin-antitoxin system HipA family toxin [Subsaximicrobium wynnwilliamsii]TXD90176.1 type II toxin-antitoxin system HipA family toxin [Subsaximicrobium wynnwilliamsii]TXE04227.1 type II toxin-antitoxin system HipA family toxin [Subsaximicrobium wynnwilliamsii]
MATGKFDIYVFADWATLEKPTFVGVLSAHFAKGKKAFGFEYDKDWLKTDAQRILDPDIAFFSGPQYPTNKENFGIFLDSMPDTWGKTLMKRRAAQDARAKDEKQKTLYEIDYLLGVFDESRMGALRFKTDLEGPFLDNDAHTPTPPWSSLGDLQEAARQLESDEQNDEIRKWIAVLIAPGSSLGGARPKANIFDAQKNLWIAKFPSKTDTIDKASWEFLAYRLAVDSGIEMAESKIEKISGQYHTFLTKRFDRYNSRRIHFASAMTMTGNTEDSIKDTAPSYLEIVEFIENYGVDVEANLHQLWRRIVFNIAISNTDDHLRNHGFILTDKGWILSPAYDLNPSIEKDGLSLNIDMDDNALDFELAKSVGKYFRLSEKEMQTILDDVLSVVKNWKIMAKEIGIKNSEMQLMAGAFRW